MNKRSDNLLVYGLLALLVAAGLFFFVLPNVGTATETITAGDSSSTSDSGSFDSERSDSWDSGETDERPPTIDSTISYDDLPTEAHDTIALIDQGGPFPYSKDGSVFQNREGLLPDYDIGWYREYTVDTPGASNRGARRIVGGDDGTLYWTADHYESFAEIQ